MSLHFIQKQILEGIHELKVQQKTHVYEGKEALKYGQQYARKLALAVVGLLYHLPFKKNGWNIVESKTTMGASAREGIWQEERS